ncbi:glutamate--tRNA ligase 2 [Dendroctonus ponderosae]|uniref:glutamate--tRNA ligase 2 n=1 Tax=Dendroctonus ponderosae TaxID=77166 RepID=UPI002035FE4A|nr:glutamate--tRNA ligase 2 [Dendroctonus ponderosae]
MQELNGGRGGPHDPPWIRPCPPSSVFSHGDISAQLSDDYISKVLSWALTRIQNLPELFSPGLAFIWTIPESYNVDQNIFSALPSLKQQLSSTSEFNKEKLNVLLKQTSKEHNLKYGLFMKSLRKILSGLQEGPGIAEMMEILGKENTIRRLDLCLNKSLT